MTTTLHDIYARVNSLDYKMELAAERTQRIAAVVAQEQLSAAATLAQPKGRGNHARQRRLAFWADRVRELASP